METWPEQTKNEISEKINEIILQYVGIKKLFSPVVYESGLSLPDELNNFILQSHNPQLEMSPAFVAVIKPLLQSYGIADITGHRSEMHQMQLHLAFMLLKRIVRNMP